MRFDFDPKRFSAQLTIQFAIATVVAAVLLFSVRPVPAQSEAGPRLDSRLTKIPYKLPTSIVRIDKDTLATVQKAGIQFSRDRGRTWSTPIPIQITRGSESAPGANYAGGGKLLYVQPSTTAPNGVLILAYVDTENRKHKWDPKLRDDPDARADAWVVRSLDQGKTWIDRQKLYEGYSGGFRDMVVTPKGTIVIPFGIMLHNPGHFAIRSYVSSDQGKSWTGSNTIDLGGAGDHDGADEPTLVPLRDGRIWMLIRTSLGRLWEAFSSDEGLHWRLIRPSAFDASSAPAEIKRLESGRLILLWNRVRGESGAEPRLLGPPHLEKPSSYFREELSLSISSDDGQTWTSPVVVARGHDDLIDGSRFTVQYPKVLEVEPGLLWIFMGHSRGPYTWASVQEGKLLANATAAN